MAKWGKLGGWVVVTGLGLLTVKNFVTSPLALDSWTHLATGRYIAVHQQIPQHADVSYKLVEPGMELAAHSWLADVVFFGVYDQWGEPGGAMVLVVTYAAALGLLELILRKLGIRHEVRRLGLGMAAVSAMAFWKLHPLVIAIPLVELAIVMYVYWLEGRNSLVLGWPVVILAFANLAGGDVFVPLAFMGMGVVLAMLAKWVGGRAVTIKGNLGYALGGLAASVLAAGISPWGGRWLTYSGTLFNFVTTQKAYSSLAGMLLGTNYNNLRNYPSSFWYAAFLIYSLSLVAGVAVFLARDRMVFLRAVWRTLPLAGFLWLGYVWVRFIPLAVFVSMPAAMAVVSYGWERIKNWRWAKEMSGVILVTAILAVGWRLGVGTEKQQVRLPVEQINFIIQHRLQANLLPSVENAGYLYYQTYPWRGYLDAGTDLYDEGDLIEIFGKVESFPQGYMENITSVYDVRTILVTRGYDFLITYVNKSPDWALVYFDTNGVLFVRRDTVDPLWLAEKELKYVDFTRNLGFDPEKATEAMAEMEKFTSENPSSWLAWGQLASMYRLAGKYDQAEAVLQQIPETGWNYAVKTEMARVMAAQGKCRPAEGWFLDAIAERGEQNLSRTVLDLAVLYAACFEDKAKAAHYFKRYNSFPLPAPEREKAWQIAADFGIKLDKEENE